MKYPKKLGDLCSPAMFYFCISILALFISLFQNIGNNGKYTLGNFSMKVPSIILVFIAKFIYIIFWTWILNLICKDGHVGIAWLLALLPFILFFIVIFLLMLNM